MTRAVHKYMIPATDQSTVSMREGAQILSVAHQHGEIFAWALVDPDARMVPRALSVRGTGHPADGLTGARFIGSVIFPSPHGDLVFHVWDGAPA